MLRCADGSLYTGVAKDLTRRLSEHNGGSGLGARYTRGRRPVTLVYAEAAPDRSAACRREHAIKRLKPSAKQALAAGWSGRNQPKGGSSAKV
jgi:putative endonuclease